MDRGVSVVEGRGASRACGADAFIDPNLRHWDGVVAMCKEHQMGKELSWSKVSPWERKKHRGRLNALQRLHWNNRKTLRIQQVIATIFIENTC